MSHVQVLTVQPSTLTRTLRLTGSGRLQQLSDHAGDHTGKRPRQPDGRRSRAASSSWRAHALCVQSRFFPASHQLSEGPRCAVRLPTKHTFAPRTLYQHHAIAVKDLEQAESAEVQASGDLASAEAALKVMGVSDPEALVKAPPSFEVPVLAPIAGEVVEQDVSVGAIAAARQHAMLHDFEHQHGLGAGQRLSERFALRSNRRRCHHPDRCVSRRFSGTHLIRGRIARSHDPDSAGPHTDQQSRRKAEERYVRNRVGPGRNVSKMRLQCRTQPSCATARTSHSFTPSSLLISSEYVRSLSAKA